MPLSNIESIHRILRNNHVAILALNMLSIGGVLAGLLGLVVKGFLVLPVTYESLVFFSIASMFMLGISIKVSRTATDLKNSLHSFVKVS